MDVKQGLFTAVMLVSPALSLAADLFIKAGETYTVGADQAALDLENLRIGDGATLRFSPEVQSFSLSAKRAEIGRNVLIDGRGTAGLAGEKGGALAGQAAKCQPGAAGGDGASGSSGRAGIAMNLRLGIARLGNLTIDSRGGDGGAGGRGGNGQQGGDIGRCIGPAGGDGGRGGVGGDGGDGGDVRLVYWGLQNDQTAARLEQRIAVNSSGGSPGQGGAGGVGGDGVAGQYLKGAGPNGNRWLRPGPSGNAGAEGAEGRPGRDGLLRMDEDFRAQLKHLPSGPSASGELAELKAAIEALERRVQQLEGLLVR